MLRKSVLAPLLGKQSVIVMDGGMGTALGAEAQKSPMWGSELNLSADGRKIIRKVHRDFLQAGADMIGTNTYCFSLEALSNCYKDFLKEERGKLAPADPRLMSLEEYAKRHLQLAVEVAREERDDFVSRNALDVSAIPLVVASVGPTNDNFPGNGATDANSNPRADPDIARRYYLNKLPALNAGKPDIFALETLTSFDEAVIAVEALEETCPNAQCLVAFTSTDGKRTKDNALSLTDALVKIARYDSVVACGVNCVNPLHVTEILQAARKKLPREIALLVYPNSGEIWDSRLGKREWSPAPDGIPYLCGHHAVEWRNAGAQIIGGCCNVKVHQIGEFKRALLGNSSKL